MQQNNTTKTFDFGKWFGSVIFFTLIVTIGVFIIKANSTIEKKAEKISAVATSTSALSKKKELSSVIAPTKILTETYSKKAFPKPGETSGYLVQASGSYPTNTPQSKSAEKRVKKFINDFMTEYDTKEALNSAGSYEVSADGSVAFSHGKKLLSYLYTEYREDGGAHGNIRYSSETYDMNGQQYTLDGLFLSNADYLEVISRLAIAHFAKDPKLNFDAKDPIWGAGLDPKPKNFETFTISGDALIFQFQDYQIGSHADGPQKFEVSLSLPEMKPLLNPTLF